MRVVIFGASGNVGIALIRALTAGTAGHEIIGVARRKPSTAPGGAEWVAADIAEAQLEHIVRGADAVVHLAWLIQPSRSPEELRSVNIGGTARLLAAVAAERVPVFVYASSVGAYSPAPKAHPVDESRPTHGIDTSSYSRQKAYTERMLDAFEARNPDIRTVRLRPALIFQTEASASQRRYFAGPFLPRALLRPGVLPFVPYLPGVRFQAVHAADAAEAYRLALLRDVRGAFNIAADPVLSLNDIAKLLRSRAVPVPVAVARTAMDLTWRLRLQPTPTGWLDMAVHCPVLDASRARAELGWTPGFSGREAVRTVLRGIALGAAGPTPPLQEMSVGEHLRQARR
jgi:UDP-glucose 4-epimerase